MNKMTKNQKNKLLCNNCAICCSYIVIPIKTPKNLKDVDRLIWYLYHNVEIYIYNNKDWVIKVDVPCKNLTKDKLCSIYKKRPLTCRDYNTKTCEKFEHFNPYNFKFTKREELIKYLKKYTKILEKN